MASIRQLSFEGGELSPLLYGRSDLEAWQRGAATLKNFFVSKHGVPHSRPGMQYLQDCKYAGSDVRLVPFVAGDAQSDVYLLEVGHTYIRFFSAGVQVAELTAQPYTVNDVASLRWAQVGDVLVLVCPGHPPRELRRTSTTPTFTLAEAPLAALQAPYTAATHPRLVDSPAGSLFYVDLAHPPREWQWLVSQTVMDNATGQEFETYALDVQDYWDGANPLSSTPLPGAPVRVVLYPDRGVTIRRPPGAVWTWSGYTFVRDNYYRGRGGVFGYVGSSSSTDFFDDGREPNYLLPPLQESLNTTFNVFSRPFGTPDYPVAVTHFEQRRIYAGGGHLPTGLFASALDQFSNFERQAIPVPGQSLQFELASKRRERMRDIVSSRTLVALTESSVWSISGAGGEGLDIDSIQTRLVDEVGAAGPPALVVDGDILYVRAKGRGVRALVSDGQGGWRGVDISWQSQHLFVGGETPSQGQPSEPLSAGRKRTIVDWCYAEDPWGLVWAVRDDGVLLSLTYQRGGRATWTRHETDGFVRGVCAVPEGDEDAVYLVVQRDGVRQGGTFQLERFQSRVRNDSSRQDACVDSYIEDITLPDVDLAGPAFPVPARFIGKEVWLTSVGNTPLGPYLVDVSGFITIGTGTVLKGNEFDVFGNPRVRYYLGTRYECDVEPLDIAGGDARTRAKTVVSVGFEVDQAKGLQVGQRFDDLTEWRQRTVSDGYSSPSTASTLVVAAVKGRWDRYARACLRQALPLPVTVLGVVREVDVGGVGGGP